MNTNGRTDGRTDGRYQLHYLPRFAVDNYYTVIATDLLRGAEFDPTSVFLIMLVVFHV